MGGKFQTFKNFKINYQSNKRGKHVIRTIRHKGHIKRTMKITQTQIYSNKGTLRSTTRDKKEKEKEKKKENLHTDIQAQSGTGIAKQV